jgi:DNA-binding beta-propeller fold protein YncE
MYSQAPEWALCSATSLSGSPPELRQAHVLGDLACAVQGRGGPRRGPPAPAPFDTIPHMRTCFRTLLIPAILSSFAFADDAALVVVQKLSGTVGFYDAAGKHLTDVKVGAHPHEMALSPDGKTLYVSDNGKVWMTEPGDGENTISVVDIPSRTKTATIDLGSHRRPHGIVVDPKTGHVLATTEKPNGLVVVDPATKKVLRAFDVKGQAPHMVMLSPDSDWAFTSDSNSDQLSVIHLSTGEVKLLSAGKYPQGQAFSPDRKTLYVTFAGDNAIGIFDMTKQQFIGRVPTGNYPNRVAVTPDGKTLVYSLQKANGVGFADVATRKEIGEVPAGGPTMSLSLSRDGKLAYT